VSDELVTFEARGAVAIVTLNRPPVNALSDDLIAAIDDAVAQAADSRFRAAVITGEPHFAAGADITGFQAAFDAGQEDHLASDLGSVVRRLERLDKPTIAAVRGYALGGGLELAMGADFRYLSEDAQVGQPEILLGIIAGAGGTQRLARIVGYQKAKELNMSGRRVGAEEALTLGLADRMLPADELLPAAVEDATAWASGPTQAYAAIKRAMGEGFGTSIEDALAAEQRQFRNVFGTKDARAGIKAFLAKAKPEFTGE
jgi:enoyl-CoA hydratase/carnithine racemase